MKKWCALVCISLAFATLSAAPLPTNNGSTSPSRHAPTAGMTKGYASEYYGDPYSKEVTASGERWHYRLKFNEVYGRAFVPFYYDSSDVRWGYIDFGTDGRAKSWHWQHATLQ